MPLRISSYNLGALMENAFSSKDQYPAFYDKLKAEVSALADVVSGLWAILVALLLATTAGMAPGAARGGGV